MKFNFKEIYGASEKTGITKCEIRMTNHWYATAVAESLRMILRAANPKYINEPLPKLVNIPESFVGYAKLAEGDTFDSKVGRKIAREKAYEKFRLWVKEYENYVKYTASEIGRTFTIQNKK